MTLVPADSYVNKYEWLQVLLVVLLFCAHFVLFVFVLLGGVHIGLLVGVLELVVGRKISSRLTLRATDAPTSIRTALGGLRPWLVIFGAFIAIVSVGYLAAIGIAAEYE